MTDQEAKFILQAYRANGADARDPNFAAALELARRDPALGEWLARQQAFDRVVASKLNEIQPPAGLRAAILAGSRLSAPSASSPARPDRSRWYALAAGLAVLLSIGLALWPKRAEAGSTLVDFVAVDATQDKNHGGHGPGSGALQVMLSQPNVRLGAELPIDFTVLRTTGCRTLGFEKRPVLEVCFRRNGQWFHCYVVRRSDFPAFAATATPVISDVEGVPVATWGDANHIYLVASPSGRAPLEQLI